MKLTIEAIRRASEKLNQHGVRPEICVLPMSMVEELCMQNKRMEKAIREYVCSDGWVPREILVKALPNDDWPDDD